MKQIDTDTCWGTYTPRGHERFLFLLRDAGLAHGPVKRYLSGIWLDRHPETPVDILYKQIKYRLYPQDNVTDRKILFGSGLRDREELDVLRQSISGGGIFVDIGANIGYYSLMAASFGASRVIAIEPNPDALARLEFNIEANRLQHLISVEATALGTADGEATLYVPVDGDMGGGKVSDNAIEGRRVNVRVQPLLSVLQKTGVSKVDALKIDVEGMEDHVLFPFFEQAPASLWPRMIIIEHTSASDWDRDILAWLLSNGYRTETRTRSNQMLLLDENTEKQ